MPPATSEHKGSSRLREPGRDEASHRIAAVPPASNADADAEGRARPGDPGARSESESASSPELAPKHESLDKAITHTLEEARMVLPGVQALFGFQLVAVLNPPFYGLLSLAQQRLHLGGLLLTALSIALMMTPAAYHRQAEQHSVSMRFLRLASWLITAGMFTLMLALQIDCYLVARIILRSAPLALGIALGLGAVFVSLWFVMPRLVQPGAPKIHDGPDGRHRDNPKLRRPAARSQRA
jgi:hypothetical protein